MNDLLEKISLCIQKGKIDQSMAYPAEMKEQPGVDEYTRQALTEGCPAGDILTKAMIPAMGIVGDLFRDKKLFVPQVLMSAKAMSTAMKHLKPYFQSGEIKQRGVFIIGTVSGDLHDIGKNLVAMMIEGSGWQVVDLGVDVEPEAFLDAISKHEDCVVGLSALLTTTMDEMEKTVKIITDKYPRQKILVGGAPVNADFASSIGASYYAPNPQAAVEYINSLTL